MGCYTAVAKFESKINQLLTQVQASSQDRHKINTLLGAVERNCPMDPEQSRDLERAHDLFVRSPRPSLSHNIAELSQWVGSYRRANGEMFNGQTEGCLTRVEKDELEFLDRLQENVVDMVIEEKVGFGKGIVRRVAARKTKVLKNLLERMPVCD